VQKTSYTTILHPKGGIAKGSAKIEFKLGGIDFSGEGEEKWVASQLDKILERAPELLTNASAPADEDLKQDAGGGGAPPGEQNVTLAKFLQQKTAGSSQVRRFLATAEWLTIRGNKRPTTSDVSKALKDNHQNRLANPADCLNKNVSKGYCEKDGKKFFVTPEGRKSLG
jgi:hypothetical protein